MTGEPAPDLSTEPPPDRRPWPAYLHPGAVVVVPASVAAWLIVRTDLPARRIEHRGTDPQVDAVLGALTVAGLGWRTSTTSAVASAGGSAVVIEAEVAPPLEPMNTSRAADVLGITDRGVRLACNQGRIPATRVDGRWQLDPAGVAAYRRTRMGI